MQESCKIPAKSHKIPQDPAGSCKILQERFYWVVLLNGILTLEIKSQSKQKAMVIVSYMQCYEFSNYIQWLEYYCVINNVFVLLSRVSRPSVKQIDCIFSYGVAIDTDQSVATH